VITAPTAGGILSTFYFLDGTVFVINPIVMANWEQGKESTALAEELAANTLG
jgi:hypothetical protein